MRLYKDEQQTKIARNYFAECLRLVGENAAKMVNGEYIKLHLAEILEPKPEEKRSSDEIINSIKAKLAE